MSCQISLDGFAGGEHVGKAEGMGLVIPTADGLRLSWRNVLTIGNLVEQ